MGSLGGSRSSARLQARLPSTAPASFLDPGARDFYADWERAANYIVAFLRTAVGRDPHDRDLSDLVGELSTQSAEFWTRWATHNVRFHDTGTKDFHHPIVGDLTLRYNRMELSADPGLAITSYTAEPQLQVRRGAQPPRKLSRDAGRGGHGTGVEHTDSRIPAD